MPQALPNPPALAAAENRRKLGSHERTLHAPWLLRFWHLASLDAPSVAAVWALAFAWAAQVRLPVGIVAAVALVVWAAYITDRILDARRAFEHGRVDLLRERHFFHWRNRRSLVPLAVVAAAASAVLVPSLIRATAAERDAVVAVGAAVYFTRVHARRRGEPAGAPPRFALKEFLVGVLFTAGCVLPAWNRTLARPWELVAPAALFAATAWLNCTAIDIWESEHRVSAARLSLFFTGCTLCAAGLAAASVTAAQHPRSAALLLAGAVSAALLGLLDRIKSRMEPLLLRAAADLALLTPLAVLLARGRG